MGEPIHPVGIRLSSVQRALAVALVAVAAAGLAVELLHHGLLPDLDEDLVALFSLSYEGNLPTWYSSALLLACAVTLGVIAAGAPAGSGRYWSLLAAVFGYLSIDEAVGLHEQLNGLVELGGPFYFGWIIPAGAAVLLLGLAFLRFLVRLPAESRRRFILAGALYVGGALLMEIPLGMWTEARGDLGLGYALIDFVEESLEMIGATIFLLALLRHAANHGPARLELEDR
jgi:hypothetical protein